jgi:uncharacterized protein
VTSVVLDTNIFISAFVFGGKPRRVVRLAEAGAYVLAISQAIQDETERILLEKFRWRRAQVERACNPIWDIARIITPEIVVSAAQDPDDNRILECALEARALAIVTGDRDLLCLHPYEGIIIISPAEFLRRRLWYQRQRPS